MDKNLRREIIKRKKMKRRVIFKTSLLVLLSIAIYYLITRSTMFAITKIEVTGYNKLTAKEIIKSSGIRYGDNLIKLNIGVAKQKISTNDYIESVNIKKKLLSKIQIFVVERKGVAQIATDEGNYLIDAKFNPLEFADAPFDILTIKGYENKIFHKRDEILEIVEINPGFDFFTKFFESSIINEMTEISILPKEIRMITNDDIIVEFGDGFDSEYKFKMLKETLENIKNSDLNYTIQMNKGINPIILEGQ